MRIPKFLLTAIILFNLSQSLFAQLQPAPSGYGYYVEAPVAAGSGNSGFTQLWHDNAIMWKYGNFHIGGLRFGSATDLNAANWTERMRIADNGFVGIGTGSPNALLSLGGGNGKKLLVYDDPNPNGAQVGLGINMSGNYDELSLFHSTANSNEGDISFGKRQIGSGAYTEAMRITGAGNVGIGTTDTKSYKLAVNGNAIFNKVVVKAYPWPDYVFYSNYRLRPLSEVEQYINQYHHLPEVPTAAEVEKNGIDVGDNQVALLKKIEELTLYVIEQEKQIHRLANENKELELLKKEVEELKVAIKQVMK